MRSVGRALEVLETIADLQPVGVTDIARHLNEPKSSVQRVIDTLAKGHWITRQTPDVASWSIAVRTTLLGRRFAEQMGVGQLALETMERLRQETGETIHLAIPRETSVILIERLESPHPVRYVEPLGGAASIFLTATGKSILANFDDEQLKYLIITNADSLSKNGIEPRVLEEELDQVRQDGFSTTRQWRSDVFATAAAILGEGKQPLAAISISAPASRVGESELVSYPTLVRDAAREITKLIERR